MIRCIIGAFGGFLGTAGKALRRHRWHEEAHRFESLF
jgi:hypothetical protein